jgi:hypothetical protein
VVEVEMKKSMGKSRGALEENPQLHVIPLGHHFTANRDIENTVIDMCRCTIS